MKFTLIMIGILALAILNGIVLYLYDIHFVGGGVLYITGCISTILFIKLGGEQI